MKTDAPATYLNTTLEGQSDSTQSTEKKRNEISITLSIKDNPNN